MNLSWSICFRQLVILSSSIPLTSSSAVGQDPNGLTGLAMERRVTPYTLCPVPEDIQRRGYQRAGKLWCQDYWKTPDDLTDMQVKRVKGERRYRFFTLMRAPTDVFWKVSSDFPTLKMRLVLLGTDRGDLQSRFYYEGTFQGSYSPNGADGFAAIREEMGFAA